MNTIKTSCLVLILEGSHGVAAARARAMDVEAGTLADTLLLLQSAVCRLMSYLPPGKGGARVQDHASRGSIHWHYKQH